jgi:hypothetical protein
VAVSSALAEFLSSSGAAGVSASLTVTEQSLVVVIAMASSQEQIQLSGLSGLEVDASSTNTSGEEPMVIAHAFLSPGSYTVNETSSVGNLQGQHPKHMADLIGVFIFGGE